MTTEPKHSILRRYNFFFLLGGLLILLLAGPIARDLDDEWAIDFINISFAITLILSVWSLMESRRWYFIGIGMVVGGIACTVVAVTTGSEAFTLATLAVMLMFLFLTMVIAGYRVLFTGTVNGNEIAGAICIYLLLGVIWAILYLFLDIMIVDAFAGVPETHVTGKLGEFTYFSFVTLTTLGYGEITPVSSTARALASLEAISGQLYIAILMASLVTIYISRKPRD